MINLNPKPNPGSKPKPKAHYHYWHVLAFVMLIAIMAFGYSWLVAYLDKRVGGDYMNAIIAGLGVIAIGMTHGLLGIIGSHPKRPALD